MPVRLRRVHPLPPRCAAPQARHVRFRARFVDKDELGWVEPALALFPLPPGFGDVGAVLFAGPQRLFLYVRSKATRA
jgi:hypothetical protein